MNASKATTAVSLEDESNDETTSGPAKAEIPLLDSALQESPFNNMMGDAHLRRNHDEGMKQNKQDEILPWRESLPVITLKPRSKIPSSGTAHQRAKTVKAQLFVPALTGEDEDDHDFESSAPETFLRDSETMTVKRHASVATIISCTLAQKPSIISHSSSKHECPRRISSSIRSKRSLSESSPFLSIDESSSFSTQAKKIFIVENLLTGADIGQKEILTPRTVVSKPLPVRRQHHPRSDERIEDTSPGPSVKKNTTISLSASSAFSLTF
jgi:hypothetical protein